MMFRSLARVRNISALLSLVLPMMLGLSTSSALGQTANDNSQEKSFDLKSSVGDLHAGSTVDQRELGLPAYPGARLRRHDEDRSNANLALFTSAFGVKLLVVHYDSDDDTSKIAEFYRGKLKKFGRVLECHTSHRTENVRKGFDINEGGDDSKASKELRCEGDNTGHVIELKAGTEDNQHVVAIEPAEKGKGSTIAMVYVYTRGKQGDI